MFQTYFWNIILLLHSTCHHICDMNWTSVFCWVCFITHENWCTKCNVNQNNFINSKTQTIKSWIFFVSSSTTLITNPHHRQGVTHSLFMWRQHLSNQRHNSKKNQKQNLCCSQKICLNLSFTGFLFYCTCLYAGFVSLRVFTQDDLPGW